MPAAANKKAATTPSASGASRGSCAVDEVLIQRVIDSCMLKMHGQIQTIVSELTTQFTAELKSFRDCLTGFSEVNKRLVSRLETLEGRVTGIVEAPLREEIQMNLVGIGVPEPAPNLDTATAQLTDLQLMQSIATDLSIHPDKVVSVERKGARRLPARVARGGPTGPQSVPQPQVTKPRPILVKFADSDSRRRFLTSSREVVMQLHPTATNGSPASRPLYFFRPDMTPSEQEAHRKLNAELWERKGRGEDLVISQGKIIARAARDASRTQSRATHVTHRRPPQPSTQGQGPTATPTPGSTSAPPPAVSQAQVF